MKTIEREPFEAWLFAQPPERTFDYFDVNGGCAICAFVRETTKFKDTDGGSTTVTLKIEGLHQGVVELPDWLTNTKSLERMGILHSYIFESQTATNLTCRAMQKRYLELFPNTFQGNALSTDGEAASSPQGTNSPP